jgi:hypothetical protein
MVFAQVCMIKDIRLWRISIGVALMALPLAALQFALMQNAAPSDPQLYLEQRAALDILSLSDLHWNRLPLWRVVELMAFCYGIAAVIKYWSAPLVRLLAMVAAGLLLLSLGPNITPTIQNPLFMAIWHVVPGFWRVAKPEVFFYGTWLLVLCCSSYGLSRSSIFCTVSKRMQVTIYCVTLVWWIFAVRNHEVFPGFSTPLESELGEVWRARLN